MKRRDILKYTAFATGAAIGAPLISVILSGCQSEATPSAGEVDQQLHFFSQQDFSMVKNLADVILPKTDSPSASEVGVPAMMDSMIGTVYQAADKEAYQTGFMALVGYLNKVDFGKMEAAKQLAALQQLHQSDNAASKAAKDALTDFKQQTIAYYLSTEEIGTNYLNYLPVPGTYEPCISVEEAGGKAWAL